MDSKPLLIFISFLAFTTQDVTLYLFIITNLNTVYPYNKPTTTKNLQLTNTSSTIIMAICSFVDILAMKKSNYMQKIVKIPINLVDICIKIHKKVWYKQNMPAIPHLMCSKVFKGNKCQSIYKFKV